MDPLTQLFHAARAAHQAGRLDAAVRDYRRVLKAAPDAPQALHLLGVALLQLGRAAEALGPLRRAARLQPADAAIRMNLGNALAASQRQGEAIDCYREAVRLQPALAEGWFSLGNLLDERGEHAEALAVYDRAVALDGRHPAYRGNRALCLKALGRVADAEADLRAAVSAAPGFADAWVNLGNLLRHSGRPGEAAQAYAQGLVVAPSRADIAANLWWVQREACEWRNLGALEDRLVAAVAGVSGEALPGVQPFAALALPLDPRELKRLAAAHAGAAERAARQLCPGARPAKAGQGVRPQRLVIGYASTDFHDHATAHLIAGLLEVHDRARFAVRLYSYGRTDDSAWRERLVAAADEFVDTRALSLCEAAARIRADGVHVLVDLKGYTAGGRPALFALRPAPVIVNYLGFPGTMGAVWYDAYITDAVCSPPGSEAHFAERLVRLPQCYQPNDRAQAIAAEVPSRAECGLPAEGFVYCCFNQTYKIEPAVFDVWMRILGRVPGSVLWLFRSYPEAEANLRREAQVRGIAPERLVFADKRPKAEHLARHARADLLLDTLRVNAHTTASDALWAGLPVLTCPGETFQSRVAASLLHAVGLPGLVMPDLASYEETAVRLATEPGALAAIRHRLDENRLTYPLFDTERYARDLERAYDALWDARGGTRTPIDLSPCR
jgi:predicted O-linked N-acetylglucosamine transferase (SPINDLY family)